MEVITGRQALHKQTRQVDVCLCTVVPTLSINLKHLRILYVFLFRNTMEATLKALVLVVLPNLTEDKRQEVVTALLTQGILEPEDLQFVNSPDQKNILPPHSG